MSLSSFKATNHPQQTAKRGAIDAVDDRRTPPDLFARLHEEFGFTLDAAASAENALLPKFFTAAQDGVAQSWTGEVVWCNPPYSDCRRWVEKAHAEMARGCKGVVMLLPANRTEQKWWQELVEPDRDAYGLDSHFSVRFLPGRLRFARPQWTPGPKGDRPPFGCCLLVWRR